MITCPICGTQNSDQAVTCDNCGQPFITGEEQEPNWLQLLLAKYGEQSGPLIGLKEKEQTPLASAPSHPVSTSEEEAELSALLDQMADTDSEQPDEDMSATSVEWGAPAETPLETPPPVETESGSLDDFLAGLDTGESPPPAEAPPPEPVPDESEVPDWLAGEALDWIGETPSEDLIESLVTDDEPEFPAAAEEPASTPDPTYEVPDWLSEEPDVSSDEPPAPEPPSSESSDMPDFMNDTAADETPVPDWLMDAFTTPPEPSAPASPAEEALEDVPDEEDSLDSIEPEWMEQYISPTSDSDEDIPAPDQIPDWLADGAAEAPPSPAEAVDTPADWDMEIPDWLKDSNAAPADDDEDWLPEPGTSDQAINELEDWLSAFETASVDQEEDTPPPDTHPEPPAMPPPEPPPKPKSKYKRLKRLKPQADKSASDPSAETPDAGEGSSEETEAAESDDVSEAVGQPPAPEPASEPVVTDMSDGQAGLSDEIDESPAELPTTNSDAADVPDWLADISSAAEAEADIEAAEPEFLEPEAAEVETEAEPPEISAPDREGEVTAWLAGLRAEPEPEAEGEPEDAADVPDWLADISSAAEAEVDLEAAEPEFLEAEAEVETEAEPPETVEPDREGEVPAWLAGLRAEPEPEAEGEPEEAADVPDWLADISTAAEAEADLEAAEPERLEAEEPEAEAELSELESEINRLESAAQPPDISAEADVSEEVVSDETPDWLAELGDEDQLVLPDWLSDKPDMSPASEIETDEDKLEQTDESTGLLTTLSPVARSQKTKPGPSVVEGGAIPFIEDSDAVENAAQQFYAAATQTPPPAVLPTPTSDKDRLITRAVRGAIYLIFMLLISLPLLPGLQKVVNPETGQKGAWTEPTGEQGLVLDQQRRQLISTELGVVDLQQPEAVALVSVDYTPGTQGEMQPLAEAIIGRLRGQGMRLIFTSLHPEGATVARNLLENTLTDREEVYGEAMVNLGYLPGQLNAVRELSGGQVQFGPRFGQNGLFSDEAAQAAWAQVKNMAQVDMVVTLTDNPATARWWIEQMETAIPAGNGQRLLVAGSSAAAAPFLQPYRDSGQLDGLVSGINGAAAIEAGRRTFGPARQMLDSQSIAHLFIIIMITLGTIVGWMPTSKSDQATEAETDVVSD